MSQRRAQTILKVQQRIAKIRESLASIDMLCSGTLLKRMMKCGKPNCRCAVNPEARHGPYFEWTHLKGGKLQHRYISAEQAERLAKAIANYRSAKKLMRAWEQETERLIDADTTP
jgi:hypothetical protein